MTSNPQLYCLAALLMCLAVPVQADFWGIANDDIIIEKDQESPPNYMLLGYTFPDFPDVGIVGHTIMAEDLVVGVSGMVTTVNAFNTPDMVDDLELNWTFAPRNGESPPEITTRMFGGSLTWQDTNGEDKFDFFIWEIGGNDQFTVRAILPDDVMGEVVVVDKDKWKDFGDLARPDMNANGSTANGGQDICGIAFKVTDLLDENGQPLPNDAVIWGLQFSSPGLDPSSIHAIFGAPDVEPETEFATHPAPIDTALVVPVDTDLTWNPGLGAIEHIVVIDTNIAAVEEATEGVVVIDPVYTPGHLDNATTYYWKVIENDGDAQHAGEVWSFTTVMAGTGGLSGDYFTDTRELVGDPALTRVDPLIDFTWDANGPDESIGGEDYSIRWRGELVVPETTTYELIMHMDDGARIYIDDVLVAVDWNTGGARDLTAPVDLEVGNHALMIEYFQAAGGASAHLDWASPRIMRQVIPSAHLVATVQTAVVSPLQGAMEVAQDARLQWTAVEAGAKHDVYVGDSFEAVDQATPDTADVYQGQVEGTIFDLSGLDFGKRVFWRIDSANGDVIKGRVWNFTVAVDCLIIDDIERYLASPDEATVWWTWFDGYAGNGTGSTAGYLPPPYVEQISVNSGRFSMPFSFDNDGDFMTGEGPTAPLYSEIEREFDPVRDWSQVNGPVAASLSLAFRGSAAVGDLAYDAELDRYTIQAQGNGLADETDSIVFAYTQFTGDGDVVVRVRSLERINGDTISGLMIRESLDPGALMVFAGYQSGGQATLRWRDAVDAPLAGDIEEPDFPATIVIPQWFRITRTGDTFAAAYSADKVAWEPLGDPVTVDMSNEVFLGLGVAANIADDNVGTTTTSELNGLEVTGSVDPALPLDTVTNVGMPKNPAEPFYVAVEDAAGKVAVANHPDNPMALQSRLWQDWMIDLAAMSAQGVDLTQVKKIYIGVGDRDNPTVGAEGLVLVDDIRLCP